MIPSQVTLTSSGPYLHCPSVGETVQVWVRDHSSQLPCASQKFLPSAKISVPAARIWPTKGPLSFGSFLLLCSQCFIAVQIKVLLPQAAQIVMPGSRPHSYFWGSGLERTKGRRVFQVEHGCKYQEYRVKWGWILSIAFQHLLEVLCTASVGYLELKPYSSSRMRKKSSSQCQSH